MPFITWTDTMSIGNREIDIQHKQFVVIINQMHDAMKSGTTKQTLPVILIKLAEYITFHFTYEEKIMSGIGYPGTVAHKYLHQVFAQNVNKTIQGHTDGKILISLEVMNTLKDWLITHIMNEDKKYAVYSKKSSQ